MIISNDTDEDLTLSDLPTPGWGYWVTPPPSTLKAHSSSERLALIDSSGPAGTEGSFIYQTSAGSTFTATFGCPFSGKNYGTWTGDFKNQNFDLSWSAFVGQNNPPENGAVPPDGHPCSYNFTIKSTTKK